MRIFRPRPWSREAFDSFALAEDLRSLRRFGQAGASDGAVYMNGLFLERRYYIPYTAIKRIYKRIAMTKGGFTGKGAFASIAYVVAELKEGGERKCALKREEDADMLLSYVKAKAPYLLFASDEAERRLDRYRREQERRFRKHLTEKAEALVSELRKEKAFLEERPALYERLSAASRRKRADDLSNPYLRYLALIIAAIGLASAAFGIFSFIKGQDAAIFFVLFGLGAVFLFSGVSVIPSGQNSRKAIQAMLDSSRRDMEEYIQGYEGFLLPARYAHPAVIERIIRVVREGRAEDFDSAFSIMKADLKALNSDVQVEQEEYDEIIAIKPMFLIEDYR